MPTYEYKCTACSHTFEQFQSMKDAALRKCPSCGKSKLERLIGTGAAIIFKGSGFYQTDYRSESYKKAAEADKPAAPAASDSASAAPAKAETASKPEPAKPTAPTKAASEVASKSSAKKKSKKSS
ncbi:MAG: zinc ribbon domain-containing protein [Phycisphaerales bacterium]|nr:zinc ribbon domain-containing protein [Phycisphaerales bacterium]